MTTRLMKRARSSAAPELLALRHAIVSHTATTAPTLIVVRTIVVSPLIFVRTIVTSPLSTLHTVGGKSLANAGFFAMRPGGAVLAFWESILNETVRQKTQRRRRWAPTWGMCYFARLPTVAYYS